MILIGYNMLAVDESLKVKRYQTLEEFLDKKVKIQFFVSFFVPFMILLDKEEATCRYKGVTFQSRRKKILTMALDCFSKCSV